MRIVDTFKHDTMRELCAIECDQVSGGGTIVPPPPSGSISQGPVSPEPQIPPTGGFPKG